MCCTLSRSCVEIICAAEAAWHSTVPQLSFDQAVTGQAEALAAVQRAAAFPVGSS
jgi:hypothetical protein